MYIRNIILYYFSKSYYPTHYLHKPGRKLDCHINTILNIININMYKYTRIYVFSIASSMNNTIVTINEKTKQLIHRLEFIISRAYMLYTSLQLLQ